MHVIKGRSRAAMLGRIIAIAGAAGLALAAVLPASAHAVVKQGTYTLAIGWLNEPTYIGFDNAVEVLVSDDAGKPVNDLQPGDLKVQVSVGSSKSDTMDMTPSFDPDTGLGTPGDYLADLIPTAAGNYTFHVTGKVHDTPVDQTITASDKTFAVVTEPRDAQFPTKVASQPALAQLANAANARAQAAEKSARDASSSANRAMVIGIVALVAGVVIGGAGVGLAMRRRGA